MIVVPHDMTAHGTSNQRAMFAMFILYIYTI